MAIDVIGVPAIPLRPFSETNRFRHMDRLEQYFRNRQDDHKQYDWDGCLRQIGGIDLFDPEPVGYPVSYGARRPNARYNMPKVIVSNLTQMTLAGSSFPEIQCEGDELAQQALREWTKIMEFPARMAEARNFGGQQGTACWSLGVSRARFRIDVHNPKHCTVLEWADRASFIPRRVIKAYAFTRDKVDPETNSLKTFSFWYVRYWDEHTDTTWEEIPVQAAEQPDWASLPPSYSYRHDWALCPFYWVQNLCDSQEEDGEGDYEGIEDKFDEMNALLSSTSRGSRKNVDPTTVIKDVEPDDESLSKGSDAVIYSTGGADYLEMKGTGATAALAVLDNLRQIVLEEAQCVVPREDKITGAAQSAAAMRILYRPMIAKCNLLRGQYGPPIQRTLQDMLTVARAIRKRVKRIVDAAGAWLRDEQESVTPPLDPGVSDLVTLVWPPYFEPTAIDIKDAVTTAQAASGGKPVIAHSTAVEYTARMFGVHDVDEELKAIEAEAQEQADRDAQAMEREAQAFAKPAAVVAANAAE